MKKFITKQEKIKIIFEEETDKVAEMDKVWKKMKIKSRSDFIRQCISRGVDTVLHKID